MAHLAGKLRGECLEGCEENISGGLRGSPRYSDALLVKPHLKVNTITVCFCVRVRKSIRAPG